MPAPERWMSGLSRTPGKRVYVAIRTVGSNPTLSATPLAAMPFRYLLPLLLAALANGCTTAYQKSGPDGGFSETRLDSNVFKVTFDGNGQTTPEEAAELALL